MAPLVRRTWAPVGKTPVLLQRGRTFQKLSMIAALSVAPRRQRVGLYFSLFSNRNVNASRTHHFLSALARHLQNPLIVIWDRATIHRARSVQQAATRHRIELVFLPAYAPELNPVEILWGYLKKNPLANYAPATLQALSLKARYHSLQLRRRPNLLRSFLYATPLFSKK